MSISTLEQLPVSEPISPESVVATYAEQSATADFYSLVSKFMGEDPEIVKKLEFERDLLKYKASNFIGRNLNLFNEFHIVYNNTFSQLNNPEKN